MRVLIGANRLPVSVRVDDGEFRLVESAGGLATSLKRIHEKSQGLWVGWVGEPVRALAKVENQLTDALARRNLVAVNLSRTELARYYDGFSNGVIWPLFHYLLDKVNLDAELDWRSYWHVNKRYAETLARHYQPGDLIWVHDYQLLLVPGMLRRLLPDAKIGFFLHIPFPASDVFRILPWRKEVIESLLSADLVGFHTSTYRHNFQRSAVQLTAADFDLDYIRFNDKVVKLGVYPIGIDVEPFEVEAAETAVETEMRRIRKAHPDKRIILGVDRLDYTKGIPRRLLTIERLLEQRPTLRDKLLFIQVAVPSREKIAAYHDLRQRVNELSGSINAQYGTPIGSPIHLLYRSIPFTQLLALYRIADVMLVTPLRDGMNIVAKEYVAARTDEDGVLVLSEFAGAAAELREALMVNPYDISGTAATLAVALDMDPVERHVRMHAMRAHVKMHDVHRWAQRFLDALNHLGSTPRESLSARPAFLSNEVVERLKAASQRQILLDYDGTLVPFYALPELAVPDPELLKLLKRLTDSSRNTLHVTTGRPRDGIEPWLGKLPIVLHAEHGFWSRRPSGDWVANRLASTAWKDNLRSLLTVFVDGTPGSFIEEKDVSLALHYRNVDPSLARERLRWLRDELRSRALDELELFDGSKVFEIRLRGVNKGLVASTLIERLTPDSVILAIGDDRTDEDLFAALPDTAVTVKVGEGGSHAKYVVDGVTEVRALLSTLCDDEE
jgi:trehalose 6-phosphate synthase/phosphatase